MVTRIIATLLPLLLATSAEAVQLHFEAWPTQSSETCPAPCYQMRMFLQVDAWDPQEIQGIQMDIRIGDGAGPAQLPVHPARNNNAGPGNVHAHSEGNVSVPWDVASFVAKSPTSGFDGLMIHAASASFTIEGLVDVVNNPDTSCLDANRCAFVEEPLALNRVYLGFMNVTRGVSPPEFDPGLPHGGPAFGYEDRPRGVPFFIVQVGNIVGIGDAPEVLAQYGSASTGFVKLLPEPWPALLLAAAFALLLPLRHLAHAGDLARPQVTSPRPDSTR